MAPDFSDSPAYIRPHQQSSKADDYTYMIIYKGYRQPILFYPITPVNKGL